MASHAYTTSALLRPAPVARSALLPTSVGPVTAAIAATRADHEPTSRRSVLAASALGAAAFMAFGASVAPAAVDPDAEVLALERAFVRAWAIENATYEATKLDDSDQAKQLCEDARTQTGALVDQIEALQVRSMHEARLKARAVHWCMGCDILTDEEFSHGWSSTTDVRLIGQLVRGLIAMGPPA